MLGQITRGLVSIYGEGGATKWGGGQMKFHPYEKGGGGAEEVLG